MKKRISLILLAALTMFGCTRTARLYPVQGPLSAQTPAPVVLARITGTLNPGDISVVLGDGEVCRGRWARVPSIDVARGATTATVPVTGDMSVVWDTVYGTGFYVAHVLGARLYAQAVVTGNRGTVINVELYKPEQQHEADVFFDRAIQHGDGGSFGAIKGVARDNKGNIFKIVM